MNLGKNNMYMKIEFYLSAAEYVDEALVSDTTLNLSALASVYLRNILPSSTSYTTDVTLSTLLTAVRPGLPVGC